MDKFKFIKEKNFQELPKTSGVYCFTEGKETIYIGKAINIQSRVKNHFSQPSYRDHLYIERVNKIGYLETNSEIEALVLEASLIKKYQPKFNVIWKDDKNYFYVAILQNENKVPYVFITHQPKSHPVISPLFRHPRPDRGSRLINLDSRLRGNDKKKSEDDVFVGPFVEGTALKKTLRFLRKVFPYYTTKKHTKTKCTYCHLGLCPGPQVLSGVEGDRFLKEYKKNIKKLILILQGKRSAVLNSLKKEMNLLSKQNKFEEAAKIRDTINHLQQVMSHTNVISAETNSPTFLPRGKKVNELLQKILNTEKPISRIECYDISNIQGKFATGSMVVFVDGAADKSQYKKFKIQRENTPNDIAMLKETISRRLTHPEWNYPEVMLIDGGKAQLNVAIKCKFDILSSSRKRGSRFNPAQNLDSRLRGNDVGDIKIISIAKGRQELFIEGRTDPIPLKNLPQEIYNLVKNLDDEAHRFAISYHKLLRSKNIMGRNA